MGSEPTTFQLQDVNDNHWSTERYEIQQHYQFQIIIALLITYRG